mmetsp:Transcript_17331/g.27675  ORF Transcript_17331/g.27675 Transcript_17331/m.27675 type:complete len:89 (+) Transcript_17331:673-939(+)
MSIGKLHVVRNKIDESSKDWEALPLNFIPSLSQAGAFSNTSIKSQRPLKGNKIELFTKRNKCKPNRWFWVSSFFLKKHEQSTYEVSPS